MKDIRWMLTRAALVGVLMLLVVLGAITALTLGITVIISWLLAAMGL